MDLVVFWVVAPVSVAAGVLMLLQRNAVHSALFLILSQFALAVLFAVLGAHFLAAAQVIVYAGAIMVLFLFVIMFLGVDRREALIETLRGQRGLAIGLGALLIGTVVTAVWLGVGSAAPPPEVAQRVDNVRAVGELLFTRYVFPFEVTSILLIVAAIAAMVLARRPERRGLPEQTAEEREAEREPVA
ncbi:MAG TPA: NADH-quinone oxidoreductase subunit J [Solirubrobacterales bacterium]|nr:NADH-quinone oxidoreductase subunit J [Solirubrobacterales bacterium]